MAFQNIFSKVSKHISWQKAVLIAFALLNAFYVFRYSVDIPFREEWNVLTVLDNNIVWDASREGRPVLTHIIFHLLYFFNAWSIPFNVALNYIVFLADVVLLYRLTVKAAGSYPYLPLFFIPLFSDLNVFGLTQVTALQFHLTVLFGLIAADIGFFHQATFPNSLKFLLFLFLSVLSLNFVFALGVFIGWSIMEIGRKNPLRAFAAFVLLLLGTSVLTGGSGMMLFPAQQAFRSAVMFYSIALTGLNVLTPLLLFLILPVICTLGYEAYKRRFWKDKEAMFLLSIIMATFLSALNTHENPDEYIFIHRNLGVVLFCVPVVFTLMRLVRPVFIYLCCLSLIGYSAAFSATGFQNEAAARSQLQTCVRQYYENTDKGECAGVPQNSPAMLDLAKKLDLSFVGKL